MGYLLVKRKYRRDLTKEGSGNVGTLNTFKVSGSKSVAGLVLLIDFLKGAAPVYYLMAAGGQNFLPVSAAAVFLIVGHNYPVWLKFKGGRGLATAAGIFSVINVLLLVTWCIIWLMYFTLIKKDVLEANIAATFLFSFFTLALKSFFITFINPVLPADQYYLFVIFCFTISFLILVRHPEVFEKLKFQRT